MKLKQRVCRSQLLAQVAVHTLQHAWCRDGARMAACKPASFAHPSWIEKNKHCYCLFISLLLSFCVFLV